MAPVIRLSDETYNRLKQYNVGFDTPAQVINRLLDQVEGVDSTEGKKSETDPEGFVTDINRKHFVLSVGCEEASWQSSWSFVNHIDKFILFNAWADREDKNGQLIVSEDWQYDIITGRKKAGYSRAMKHFKLIEQEGYKLKTFRIKGPNGDDKKAKIESLEPIMRDKTLKRIGNKWYAQ